MSNNSPPTEQVQLIPKDVFSTNKATTIQLLEAFISSYEASDKITSAVPPELLDLIGSLTDDKVGSDFWTSAAKSLFDITTDTISTMVDSFDRFISEGEVDVDDVEFDKLFTKSSSNSARARSVSVTATIEASSLQVDAEKDDDEPVLSESAVGAVPEDEIPLFLRHNKVKPSSATFQERLSVQPQAVTLSRSSSIAGDQFPPPKSAVPFVPVSHISSPTSSTSFTDEVKAETLALLNKKKELDLSMVPEDARRTFVRSQIFTDMGDKEVSDSVRSHTSILPLSCKLAAIRNQYVSLDLVNGNRRISESETITTVFGGVSFSAPKPAVSVPITTYIEWVHCFTAFTEFTLAYYPHRAVEFTIYLDHFNSKFNEFPHYTNVFINVDASFRKKMFTKGGHFSLASIITDTSIYMEFIAASTSAGGSSSSSKSPSTGSTSKPKKEICDRWNNGNNDHKCNRSHVCSNCSSAQHRLPDCPRPVKRKANVAVDV